MQDVNLAAPDLRPEDTAGGPEASGAPTTFVTSAAAAATGPQTACCAAGLRAALRALYPAHIGHPQTCSLACGGSAPRATPGPSDGGENRAA